MAITAVQMTKFRGDTLVFPITIKDTAGIPVSLIGATIKFTLAVIPSVNQATSGVVIDRHDTEGTFTITIPPAATAGVSAGTYLMDVEITYLSGIKNTLFVIELTLERDVTP